MGVPPMIRNTGGTPVPRPEATQGAGPQRFVNG